MLIRRISSFDKTPFDVNKTLSFDRRQFLLKKNTVTLILKSSCDV